MKPRVCELCNEEANVYCSSDSAFLCYKCDVIVHSANFLVARHNRMKICLNCKSFAGIEFSGAGSSPIGSLCKSCSPEKSSSLDCVSSTESCSTTKNSKVKIATNLSKAEGILVNWSMKLGLNGSEEVARMGGEVFGECRGGMTVLPLRVLLATSFWVSLRVCGRGRRRSWEILKRVEEISGIPGKVILGAENKVVKVFNEKNGKRRRQPEEGWDEC